MAGTVHFARTFLVFLKALIDFREVLPGEREYLLALLGREEIFRVRPAPEPPETIPRGTRRPFGPAWTAVRPS